MNVTGVLLTQTNQKLKAKISFQATNANIEILMLMGNVMKGLTLKAINLLLGYKTN